MPSDGPGSGARYGVLTDVHGNLQALQAAVDELRAAGVDEWLCAGDMIGYGPQPNECVELIAELGARCVVGNHELMLLGELSGESTGSLCRETMPWTHSAVRDDTRALLAGLPRTITVGEVVMTHASLDSPERYIRGETRAADQLALLSHEHPAARLLVLGHTHEQWAFSQTHGRVEPSEEGLVELPAPDRFLLNPGATGQSRHPEARPRARSMLLDTGRKQARMLASSYDVAEARRMLRRNRLPYECIHQRRALIPGARRRAKRAIRRLTHATPRQARRSD
jgi:predicted phosphodiesterase